MATLTCGTCGSDSPDGARFCANCGSPLEAARPLEGERRFATVLFADVAGSTSIAERLDPEDWTLIINGAFGFMNAAVARYGGTVSRLMGDAVLALFGAPVAHEDDAERAVRAALEMQEAGQVYARVVRARHGIEFELRIGINTGMAVLAIVGDAVRSEYTAMGDVANVAARLQSIATPGTVLISADTQRLVHPFFELVRRGPIEVRGKRAPVECYEVIGLRAVPGNARGLDGISSPLVGRDAELGLLRERLADLERGSGSVVAVVGEAGLGKSRLVSELRQLRKAGPARAPVWLESRAISYGQSIPYYPWRQLGRQFVGSTDMDSPAAVRERLRAFMERHGLPDSDLPFHRTMLAVDTEEDRLALAAYGREALVGGVANAVVNAVRAALRADGGTSPHVVVIEDVHWADNASLELLAQVAALAAFEPLLLVCVLRPDRRAPSWPLVDRLQGSLGTTFSRIDLEPLGASASSQLLGNLLAIEDLPESMRAQILARSEGNPFYLEEVLRSLIDGGQVVRADGHWRATHDILEARIPETLSGVLSARIDRLPDATKRVVQTAAVIGRVFQHRVLESVCRAAPPADRVEHVEPHLAALSWEQLVSESARVPEREFTFKHALTCEAAYEMLLRSRRRDLHARCGAALESLFPDRRDELAPVLAHHFAEAGDVERALHFSRVAADNARRLYALKEEVEHREDILRILDRSPAPPAAEVIDAAVDWTIVRHRLNRYEGVLARLEAAVALARETGDERRLAQVLSWTGNIHMVTGFPSFGVPHLLESQALATKLGDETLMLLPLFVGTWTLVDRSPAAAVTALNEVIELAHRADVPDVEGHAMGYLALALTRLGRFDEAREQIVRALEIAPRAGSPVKRADIHISVGQAFHEMGDYDKAVEHSRIGAEGAFGAKGMECACAGYYGVGRGELELHQPERAIAEFDRSLQIVDGMFAGQAGSFGTLIRAGRAMAEFEQGREDAVEQLRVAVREARSSNDEFAAATISQELAAALVTLGRPTEAKPVLDDATSFFRALGIRPFLANALELGAAVNEALGNADDARRARAEAADLRALFQARGGAVMAAEGA